MKKLILTLTMLIAITLSTSAMSYEQARNQALFLADKMAYELNLTEDQYEAVYEINLDYLMGVNSYDELYGAYWRQRNLDMSYVLLDWQYRAYCAANYFYRPLYWSDGFWHFGIYARYPRRNYFYYGRPSFINVYVGGHSWRSNGGRSWYNGRSWGRPAPGTMNHGNVHFGMRDGFQRGDYNRGFDFARSNRQQGVNRAGSNFGGARGNAPQQSSNANFGGRQNDGFTRGNSTGTPQRPANSNLRTNTNSQRPSGVNFGGARGNTSSQPAARDNFGARQSSTRTTVGNFGNNSSSSTRSTTRANQSPANSFMPSSRSTSQPSRSSFGSGSRSTSQPSRSSFGGGSGSSQPSRSSFGGGSSNGGSHFGGRR